MFLILTDISHKITHFSGNCHSILKFSEGLNSSDVLITEIFPSLDIFDDKLLDFQKDDENTGVDAFIDLRNPLILYNEEHKSQKKGMRTMFSKGNISTQEEKK